MNPAKTHQSPVSDPESQFDLPKMIEGVVSHGDRRGHNIGFPTINIQLERGEIPPEGIYAAVVWVHSQIYGAAAYVGFRPTFEGQAFRIEAHLLGFEGDIYGESVKLAFLKFIRPDQKFTSFETLALQIRQDCQQAEQIYQAYKNLVFPG